MNINQYVHDCDGIVPRNPINSFLCFLRLTPRSPLNVNISGSIELSFLRICTNDASRCEETEYKTKHLNVLTIWERLRRRIVDHTKNNNLGEIEV